MNVSSFLATTYNSYYQSQLKLVSSKVENSDDACSDSYPRKQKVRDITNLLSYWIPAFLVTTLLYGLAPGSHQTPPTQHGRGGAHACRVNCLIITDLAVLDGNPLEGYHRYANCCIYIQGIVTGIGKILHLARISRQERAVIVDNKDMESNREDALEIRAHWAHNI
jgi:hypothetical protein